MAGLTIYYCVQNLSMCFFYPLSNTSSLLGPFLFFSILRVFGCIRVEVGVGRIMRGGGEGKGRGGEEPSLDLEL